MTPYMLLIEALGFKWLHLRSNFVKDLNGRYSNKEKKYY